MLYINQITNDAYQTFILTGITGLQINCSLQFFPRTESWIFGLNYTDPTTGNTFEVNGLKVTTALNFLRQWKNTIPFGIACVRTDGLDPFQIDDFANQVANLYLLTATDVEQIEQDWFV